MKVYLAGPMRGYPEFNFPAFRQATAQIRALGHEVFSPAEHDEKGGFDATGTTGSPVELERAGFSLRAALGADLAWICSSADGVVLLPGWEGSAGATAERATAHALGLGVWELGEFLRQAVAS